MPVIWVPVSVKDPSAFSLKLSMTGRHALRGVAMPLGAVFGV